jgi:hypothetical protein
MRFPVARDIKKIMSSSIVCGCERDSTSRASAHGVVCIRIVLIYLYVGPEFQLKVVIVEVRAAREDGVWAHGVGDSVFGRKLISTLCGV